MIRQLSKNRLRFLHKLKQKKSRDSENLFIISGLRAVKTILENPSSRPLEVIFTPDRQEMALDIFKRSIPQFELSEKEFSKLVDEKTPQGLCLVARKPDTSFAMEKITGSFVLLLDRISDPGNLGTILRSAEWFGFTTVLLSNNSADPFQPKAVRSSAGTLLNLTIIENVEVQHLRLLKKEQGFKTYATVIEGGKDVSRFKFAGKSIIMLGSEAHGLDAQLQQLCDEKISITRIGNGESLNLANAAAIIMYQAVNNLQ